MGIVVVPPCASLAGDAGLVWGTFAGVVATGFTTESVCLILEDHPPRHSGRCATLVLGACRPPGPLVLFRCVGGLSAGLHSRGVRTAVVPLW